MKALAIAGVLPAIVLTACTNTTDPVLVDEVCIRDHTEVTTSVVSVPVSCGQNCTTVRPQVVVTPYTVCDQAIRLVRPNPNYAEPR